jgi:cyclophilin family peptidyl-prolyl cis-trans isomerase
MPKTTKRIETKRAARIARAHASDLPKLQVKEAPSRRSPGYKAPARGIARYPWAVTIIVLLIAGGIFTLYANHVGPFAPHVQAKPTATAAKATPRPTPTNANSPCIASSIVKQVTSTAAAPSAAAFAKITHTYSKAPAMTIDQSKYYCVGINTNRGLIVAELDPQIAPVTVNSFVFLAKNHFYDGLKFHRVLPGTIIQTGDPLGTGAGGPGYKFNDEPVLGSYTAGTIAMANSGANTNGSQFFINLGDNTKQFAKSYNLFGHVVQGLDVAQKIQGPGDDASSKNITPDVMNSVIVVEAP